MNTKSSGTGTELLSVTERRVAGLLYNWQGLIQKHFHENVEAQTVMFFLYVSSKDEPVDLTTIGSSLGLSKAATSRNYYRLADGKTGEGGLDLIKAIVDYSDRRRMLVTLTAKGLEIARELTAFIINKMEKQHHASSE
jgi:DNA-binding MarR family transcriptional regulator